MNAKALAFLALTALLASSCHALLDGRVGNVFKSSVLSAQLLNAIKPLNKIADRLDNPKLIGSVININPQVFFDILLKSNNETKAAIAKALNVTAAQLDALKVVDNDPKTEDIAAVLLAANAADLVDLLTGADLSANFASVVSSLNALAAAVPKNNKDQLKTARRNLHHAITKLRAAVKEADSNTRQALKDIDKADDAVTKAQREASKTQINAIHKKIADQANALSQELKKALDNLKKALDNAAKGKQA